MNLGGVFFDEYAPNSVWHSYYMLNKNVKEASAIAEASFINSNLFLIAENSHNICIRIVFI